MDISKRANNLVKKYRTNCPFQLAHSLNIIVRFEDMPNCTQGFYLKTLRRRFISINRNLSAEWQRFVCAHELGHDRLHKGLGYYFIERHTLFNPGKFERQANNFAVNLLSSGESLDDTETLESFYRQNDIPIEMIGKI